MAIFKCKMCGGTLEINNGESIAICDYCGTKQTLPKLDDEKKANLFDRANHFRRNNDFDKAMGIYEQILNEDTEDAESYWSIVLCRYGIEYVEDPSSHKRVPTVNRAQFTSIFDDEDYKSAIKYADSSQKGIYEEEAVAINEIQKGILEISQKEEPFDVFICYKETDNNGRRTQDSVLATELYHELIKEGYKVFFSRITLEDKLGVAYEPYIFAALQSAKVMVVLGTKSEYFNAVWVKNEWARYLSLIKNGANKILIPAYRDMDPYDLPEEFSHLQAQDMAKLGFMQDLVRGINKLASPDNEPVVKETVVVQSSTSGNASALLKRGFLSLEDREWEKADDFFEQALNQNAEDAKAYLGKLMAELQVKKQEDLKNCAKPFDSRNNYQKAIRFGDEKLKTKLEADIDFIKNRNLEERYNKAVNAFKTVKTEAEFKNVAKEFYKLNDFKDSKEKAEQCLEKAEMARKEAIYTQAAQAMKNSKTEEDFKKAADILKPITEYKDSEALIKQCYENAEIARKEAIYTKAVEVMKNSNSENDFKRAADNFNPVKEYKDSATLIEKCYEKAEIARKDVILVEAKRKMENSFIISHCEAALKLLETIPGHRDADEELAVCKKTIEELKAKEKAERLEKERQAEIKRKKAKKRKKIAIATTSIVCAVIAIIILLNNVIIPDIKLNILYNKAITLADAGEYIEAYESLVVLDGYKDSEDKANSIYDKYKVEKLKLAKVGDYVVFGAYEQDNNITNGKEYIEWLVLEVKNGKALVISKYALDCKRYNASYIGVTWETCTLRKWLNNDFINAAFSADEKAMIPTVTVSADKNPNYRTNPGNATQDKVFLLSIVEANKYFSSNSARRCELTDYAVARGAYLDSYSSYWWWLRSPGNNQNYAAFVWDYGYVYEGGDGVHFSNGAVRPAMWIDLNADK